MTHELRTIDDLDLEGRRVLLRADFNVPITAASAGVSARVADDTRIRAALTTIDELRRRGARLVLLSHLNGPKGADRAFSMRPVADHLEKLTGAPLPLAPAVIGPEVRELTERLEPGQMLMLENARFDAGETRNDPALASAMAKLADLYVNDAFASAHLAHASTWGVARRLPSAAGPLMEREVHALSALVERPARPLVAVLGGWGVGDRIGIVRRFLALADVVCIGGGMCLPFLAALGHSVAQSMSPREDVETARMALFATAARHGRLALPKDLHVGRRIPDQKAAAAPLDEFDAPYGLMRLDIGAKTSEGYAARIARAATVFWDGSVGSVERPQFGAGTDAIADAIASTSAATVVGGGEAARALGCFGPEERVSHVSVGGSAMLEFLEGHQLPALQVLMCDTPKSTRRGLHADLHAVRRTTSGRDEAWPSALRPSC